ncbi:endonuclease/exonuclease/phosphatase family protein [Maritimibacter sp. 55A14]|uniref:endonuclease/exonuclease/phosphatase family protein n=1 Tax=Maritimibacter sp. 55A14 TaxID=2174844 RepID=UPI001E439F86|nr:endonuclease/exonuclease/phosphatase family protein [Maritimibacter sp. 55A14]
MRVATFNVGLDRRGPGLLARDIAQGGAADVDTVLQIIATVSPDVLLLTGFDYDLDGVALGLFAERLAARGAAYPHRFALRPNTGWPTGLDLDGDGRRGGPGDAQGFGYFSGQGGMALLSRFPVAGTEVRDFSAFPWRDLPGTLIGGTDMVEAAQAVQRLSTTAHWEVPLRLPGGRILRLLTIYATPPVFDGPEDRNGRRNHDEIRFWEMFLNGWAPDGGPGVRTPFVLLGDFNMDPEDGDGRREAMIRLLGHPALHDPQPASRGAALSSIAAGGVNARHRGDPALDTAAWPAEDGPGHLRVDYVLPSADLAVRGAGVFWPAPGEPGHNLVSGGDGSRHRLVWVDVE